MKMKISSMGNDAIQVQIDGEDYSIADIVHKELLGVKHVKFAGVAPPHPLIKTLTMQMHTDGGKANELLREALDNAQEKTAEILEAAMKLFPEAVKSSTKIPESQQPSVESEAQDTASIEPKVQEDQQVGAASGQEPEVTQ